MRILKPDEFPTLLKEINDPPKSLYIIGELPCDSPFFLCIVGSRKCSPYGKEVCEKLIKGLRGYNIVIVSGMAIGIDTVAHQTALKNDLRTIAFPGSGLHEEVLYPPRNFRLAEEIVEKGGCLLSEFEPLTPAYPGNFPQRNRLMAGMCHATLIIEAEHKSGTLITAKYATDYNRELLVVPGSIFDKGSEGPHLFLRLGATPVTRSSDILDALNIKERKLFDEGTLDQNKFECSPEEQKILNLLKHPLSKDEIFEELSQTLTISHINSLISLLEIKGFIKESLGKFHLQ